MGKGKTTNVGLRASAILLHNQGKSEREIAKQLKVFKTAVHGAIQCFRVTKNLVDRTRPGRPRATTEAEDKHLALMSKRNRRQTAPELRARLNEGRHNPVSLTTVKMRLKERDLNGRIATKKPLLRAANRKSRKQWGLTHKNMPLDQWDKVLWTDESKFEVFGQKRKIYVRRSS